MFAQKNIPSVIGKMNTGKLVSRGLAEAAHWYSGNPRVNFNFGPHILYTEGFHWCIPSLHVSLVLSCWPTWLNPNPDTYNFTLLR